MILINKISPKSLSSTSLLIALVCFSKWNEEEDMFLKTILHWSNCLKYSCFKRNAVVTVCGESCVAFSGRRGCGNESLIRTLLGPGGKQKYLYKSTARILYRGREKFLLFDLKNQRN